MKKIILLIILIVCGFVAYYLYIDSTDPAISWGVENGAYINGPVNVNIVDDKGLSEICFSLSGGGCTEEKSCVRDFATKSFDLMIEPEKCAINTNPFDVKINVTAIDTSILTNQITGTIELTYDTQPPKLTALRGTRYLNQGGSGVVLYEVDEKPEKTGITLEDMVFPAFEYAQNKYVSIYAHPYFVAADDFKPRIYATDKAGNLKKIRPGSATSTHTYKSEQIELSDNFLENVKDKMAANSAQTPLDAFVEINDKVRQENNQTIAQLCKTTEAEKLWNGVFLRNQGATKANFAEKRTYKYRSEVVSRQVHTGIDIAGVNNMQIVAANHGKVIFTGEIGIYGNVVIIDHGYGLHSLYGHLSQINVDVGDYVKKGDTVALSGETGLAFGDHLHFEIRVNGLPVNPIEWFDKTWVVTHMETFFSNDENSG